MLDILATVFGVVFIVAVWIALYDSNHFTVRRFQISDRRIRKPVRAVVLADLHNKRYGKDNERLLEEIRAQKHRETLSALFIPSFTLSFCPAPWF